MPKTYSEALAALEALEGGVELVEAVKSEVNKKNSENQNLRAAKNSAEAAAQEAKEQISTILKYLGLSEDARTDLPKALEAHKSKWESELKKTKDAHEAEALQLKSAHETLKAEYSSVLKERDKFKGLYETERTQRQNDLRNTNVLKILTEQKAIKPSEVAKIIAPNVIFREDGTMAYKDEKGFEQSLEDGIKAYLKANPEFVQSGSPPGGGSGPGGSGGKGTVIKVSETQARDPAWYRANREKIEKGEIIIEGWGA